MKKKIRKSSEVAIVKNQKLLKAKHAALQKLKDQGRIEAALERVLTLAIGLEGTGLGLSLSYDIVKVHGGELEVETKKGKGVNLRYICLSD